MEEKDFVTFTQAVTLKNLGFKKKVNYYYIDSENHSLRFSPGGYHDFSESSLLVSAPLLYQAQEWIREEKGYSIEPRSSVGGEWLCYIKGLEENPSDLHGSYEEALKWGIDKCLGEIR